MAGKPPCASEGGVVMEKPSCASENGRETSRVKEGRVEWSFTSPSLVGC